MNKDLIITPDQFIELRKKKKHLLVDLSQAEVFAEGTIDNAVHMPYEGLVSGELPHPSMLPSAARFARALADIGYDGSQHIVAFDDEFGLKAARLYWTLRMADIEGFSYLNGGLAAWLAAGQEKSINRIKPEPAAPLPLEFSAPYRTERAEILASLSGKELFLWDTRSVAEFNGEEARAKRGGHIPGARHLEWLAFLDDKGYVCPAEEVSHLLKDLTSAAKGRPIVAYCQAHRRSAMAFMLADYSGVSIRAYDGSWQEWGNKDDSPVSKA